MKFPNSPIYSKAIIPLIIILLVATPIWFSGPSITWGGHFPYASPEKRIYIILFLFLAWLLKFLVIDLDTAQPFQYKDPQLRKKLHALQNRFRGAIKFLNKTNLPKQGKNIRLAQLPWYLLIGPSSSGKTTLLVNSHINFILQKQFNSNNVPSPSDHCDWWVTRELTLIDVPSSYFSMQDPTEKSGPSGVLWKFFLRLMQKQRGENGINGIIITLPLPEFLQQADWQNYHHTLETFFQRITEIKKFFPRTIPCYITISKCDLLPGFTEFFAESSNDEVDQAWGVPLLSPNKNEKVADIFLNRFNALIKKINKQLLFRLHQERNPIARPYIKDFPLQLEKLKEITLDFLKKLSATQPYLFLQSVYLTSAVQNETEQNSSVLFDETVNTSRAVQIFEGPLFISRPYFIKQFLLQGLIPQPIEIRYTSTFGWGQKAIYVASVGFIGLAAVVLGKDFERGVSRAYSIQNYLSQYQLTIQQSKNPEDHLSKALALLDALQEAAKKQNFKFNFNQGLAFYSSKSQQTAEIAYRQVIQTIILPEIKNYLERYLQNSDNKNLEYNYAVLKSYLMLGGKEHFSADFLTHTLQQILTQNLSTADIDKLSSHITVLVNAAWDPLPLNTNLIEQERKTLTSLPSVQLAYIILKNINANNSNSEINLGTNNTNFPVLINRNIVAKIPRMFTANAFPNIVSKEIITAAQEASTGNGVLNNNFMIDKNSADIATLITQLRSTYINNYIDVWESLLANIRLSSPKNLEQTDQIISRLVSDNSPLLQLLQTLRENTSFEPILSSSQKLQGLHSLTLKNNDPENNSLYQIFASLQALHHYLQSILTAPNQNKAAYEAIAERLQNQTTLDAITQLRLVANKSPEPIKNWLLRIANNSWRYLVQDAGLYLNTAWQTDVINIYQTQIANHYPFSENQKHEVKLQNFIVFFGSPGTITNFYNHLLRPLVEETGKEWRWKTVDNERLPFSSEIPKQIQLAMRIHHTFFPNNDNKLYVQFSLQPYKISKYITNIKLSMNNRHIIDGKKTKESSRLATWPTDNGPHVTSLRLILSNKQIINRHFPGDWGWFEFVNQTMESAAMPKKLLLNFSMNKQPAKYFLLTEGSVNPFLLGNLRGFYLPSQFG